MGWKAKMIFYHILTVLLAFVEKGFAREDTWLPFIKSYVENEGIPTFLILFGICWDKNVEVNLAKVILESGGKVASSKDIGSSYHYHHLLFLLDLDCLQAADIIELASSRNLFRSPHRWLLISNRRDLTNSTLWSSSILPDSDVVLALRDDNIITLFELYKPSNNNSMITTLRGYYNMTLYDVRAHRELFRRRRDIMGSTITMSHVIQDSNTTRYHLPRDAYKEPHYDSTAKICWMNAQIAMEMLNATPAHVFSYRWGYKVDGQWSGMINDLYTGRADVGTNCVVHPERLAVASYVDRVAPLQVRFIFRQPPLAYASNIYSMPFHSNVWVALSLCTVLSTICLYAAAKWETKENKWQGPTQLSNICDAMLLSLSAVGQQGCIMEPRRFSGRTMLFVLFTALMALYAAYSANIVVLLQAPSNSIRSLPQLANAKITLAANDVDYNYFIFKQFKDPVRMLINKRIDPDKGKGPFYNFNDGVEMIRQGLFAFHAIVEPVYRRIEQTFLEHEKCDLMEVDFMNTFDSFIPVKKDSPYIEHIRVVLKQIRESGIQSAITRRMQVPKPRCTNKLSSFSSVGLLEMRPVLFLMLYGTVLSIGIFVVEVLVFKW